MNYPLTLAALAVCLASTAPALAQTTSSSTTVSPDGATTTTTETVKKDHGGTTAGAASGVVAGALVAGPVGAVVGGVAGATIGHTVAPPTEVKTYVTTQSAPPVTYSGQVVVGHTIDGDVAWREVPNYPRYSWARLNDQRVVIDNKTHKVVEIY